MEKSCELRTSEEGEKIIGEKTKRRSHLSLSSFKSLLSFPVLVTMVLSLISDGSVQAHFNALVEEGQQKQVSGELR